MFDIDNCKGCKDAFLCWELSDDGYCESCELNKECDDE